ncbi:YybH family protein [Chryseobacterium sp. 22532]|uniref:YybH family protein n=1 Tax=Chryseobacterium sp. 22532 TaxID=3453938 RepID=UPI003F846CD1
MINDNKHLKDFENFMQVRLKASGDFVEGKFEPLEKISVKKSPATIFPPPGICIQGASEVNTFNKEGATNFLPGAKNEFEIMHQDADEHLAYWTGIQRSTVKMKGQDNDIIFNLRVTEIFRKENDEWKLMHRHADKLTE